MDTSCFFYVDCRITSIICIKNYLNVLDLTQLTGSHLPIFLASYVLDQQQVASFSPIFPTSNLQELILILEKLSLGSGTVGCAVDVEHCTLSLVAGEKYVSLPPLTDLLHITKDRVPSKPTIPTVKPIFEVHAEQKRPEIPHPSVAPVQTHSPQTQSQQVQPAVSQTQVALPPQSVSPQNPSSQSPQLPENPQSVELQNPQAQSSVTPKKLSAKETIASLRNQCREKAAKKLAVQPQTPTPKPTSSLPAQKKASEPVPKPLTIAEPKKKTEEVIRQPSVMKLSPDVKDRMMRIDKLQDLCEEYFEAIGVPVCALNIQDGKKKICRIEVAKKVVAEANADTWYKARSKAALETLLKFDKGLCEEWLAQHQDSFIDNGNSG